MGKRSVTEILSEMYPMPDGVFEKALSADTLAKKREEGLIVPGSIADVCGALVKDNVSDMLTTVGTAVHSAAYDLGTLGFCNSFKGTVAEKFVSGVIKFFEDHEAVALHAEAALECDEFRGTTDGFYFVTHEGKRELWMLDWKTWGAYKNIYGILEKKAQSKSSEKKKVGLQLSMYQYCFDPDFTNVYVKGDTPYVVDRNVAVWIKQGEYEVFELERDISPYTDWRDGKKKKISLT